MQKQFQNFTYYTLMVSFRQPGYKLEIPVYLPNVNTTYLLGVHQNQFLKFRPELELIY